MKTPYDSALRAQRREVDDLRTAIGDAAHRAADAERQHREAGEAMTRESRLAAGDWMFSPMAYLAHARARRDRLDEERRVADAELERLREAAAERLGSLRALEGAADGFREAADRQAAGAEQAAMDDLAGARFARALHGTRQRSGAPS